MSQDNPTGLRQAIRLPQATAIVVGIIIGASIFVQPSEITGRVPSVAGIFLVWLLSGLLTFIGALVCAELASIFSRSGGVYLYLKEAYGPSAGFLWGWAMFWTMHSGIIAAIAVIFARYLSFFMPMNGSLLKAAGVLIILILSGINYLGVKQGGSLQLLFTLGKVFAVLCIIGFGFLLGSNIPEHFAVPGGWGGQVSPGQFLLAVAAGLFAFGGWHMVSYNSEETVDPKRTIPRSLLLGTLVVTVCYMAMNAVYLYVLPLDRVASSTRIAADTADALIGYGGGALMSGLVVFSTIGALNGIILCGPRVYYAMAQDGLLFSWIGHIHPRFRTPHKAIALQAVWSSVLVVTGTYRALFTRVVYTEWIFFGAMAVGLILFRRQGRRGDFRMPGYPFLPAVFILSSFAVVVNQIVSDPRESLAGLGFVLSGWPLYHLSKKHLIKESKP